MTRIGEACDNLYLSDFKGFASHSAKCFDKRLNKESIVKPLLTLTSNLFANSDFFSRSIIFHPHNL